MKSEDNYTSTRYQYVQEAYLWSMKMNDNYVLKLILILEHVRQCLTVNLFNHQPLATYGCLYPPVISLTTLWIVLIFSSSFFQSQTTWAISISFYHYHQLPTVITISTTIMINDSISLATTIMIIMCIILLLLSSWQLLLQSNTNLSTTPSQLLQTYIVIVGTNALPSLYTLIPLSIVVVIMIVTTTNILVAFK